MRGILLKSGVYLLERRDCNMANFIAAVIESQIGAVRHEIERIFAAKSFDILSRAEYQRSYNIPANGRYAAQTFQRRAAREVEEHRFGVVARGMGGCDLRVFVYRFKELIAHSAPALFASLPALFCKCCDIGVKDFKTKRVLFAEGAHIFLVAPRLLTAQPVVDMGDGQGQRIPLAYFHKKEQHCH